MKNKIMNRKNALALINDGDKLTISSAGLVGYPEYLVQGLEERFLETGSPKGLWLYAGCGHGGPDESFGDNHFAHPGFVERTICAHPDVVPALRRMIEQNQLEAYVLPQGVLNQLYRCSAARQPGLLTKIGIGTYVDPRQDGGKMNTSTREDIVRVMELDGEEWLFYKSFPVTVALLRGTTADEAGNLTIEHEALKLEILETALAARASGGRVIAQVERTAAQGTLNAKDVVVPGELVDAVVVAEEPSRNHRQAGSTVYDPAFSGQVKAPPLPPPSTSTTLSAQDIVCRRAAFELCPGTLVNVGVGIGAGIGRVAAAEGLEDITFTLELGAIGGTPQPGANFGAVRNPSSFLAHPSMFDFYHGGSLDITFLGAAEVDARGNVNVSRFAGRAAGQGGFIDISQTSKKVVFCTYFVAKGLQTEVSDGALHILEEGKMPKFVQKVEQITFNGALANTQGQQVLYVTERAVFLLEDEGLTMVEVAPGVDLERDVLGQMGFAPRISNQLRIMDKRIFRPGRMNVFT